MRIDNDEGIAYGLIAVGLFLVMASLLFICYLPVLNAIIETANSMIGNSQIGVQTAGSMSWAIGWYSAIPVIALLGIVGWACIRALEERGQ